MIDAFMFGIFPYVAFFLAIAAGCYRYFSDRFSYSSLSSQFLSNKTLFWGSVSWHYGILAILAAHVFAAVFPAWWAKLLGNEGRLYFIEITGFSFGLITVFGIGMLIAGRILTPRVRVVTSVMDWVLLSVLLTQVVLGVFIAMSYRWGGKWYLSTAVPWLASLVKFSPDTSTVVNLPLAAKFHFLGFFVLMALFPFTRLVHITSAPFEYLFRPFQVVIWNRKTVKNKVK